MTEKRRRFFFFAVFALVFYLVGASFVESFANYPTWKLVGANEFAGYYHELASRIVKLMVLPGVLEILLTIALFWLRPRAVPRWAVALALVLNMVRFVSTAIAQTRFQEQLGAGAVSPDEINRLIHADYLTQAVSIARALLYLWMAARVVGAGESETAKNAGA